MYFNGVVLWTLLIGTIIIAEVCSERFTSPLHLFSDEPNILDENYFVAEKDHDRFDGSTTEEKAHRRFRRQTSVQNRPPAPKITKSKPLCDHSHLIIRWTDTNLVEQTGAIIALCRDVSLAKTTNNAAVFVSYDSGMNWNNITDKFVTLLGGKKPKIDMYYTASKKPEFIIFLDKGNKKLFYTNDAGVTIKASNFPAAYAPEGVSINRDNPNIILVYSNVKKDGKTTTRVFLSKDSGKNYNILKSYVDVKAFYWGSKDDGDKSTDLYLEAKKSDGKTQGYKLDCQSLIKTCQNGQVLTKDAPLNEDITDFLVKGPYMFATQHNKDKSGVNLFVKYLRTGTFKKVNIITTKAMKEVFIYDVTGKQVMLVVNHLKNETNLYTSLDVTGASYSLSLPRVLYHNPKTEVSSHWLRNAVKYRFVDIWRVRGLPSVYFATQLTVGPVGGRYLISKMTFDKGGYWRKIRGPDKNRYGRTCFYPTCSLHVNLLYGSIYRYSQTTPLMSRASAPGLIMATGVAGTNLKITPDTYLSRNGGKSFKMVLPGKKRYSFGDHGGYVLSSNFGSSSHLQYSVNFNNFYHVALPNTTGRGVEIKKILTEPGEKGVAFLVIAVDNGFYHIYQVNATTSLGRPCTADDFIRVNLTDVGVGGCAIHQVEIRNESRKCITGRTNKRVIDVTYSNCVCRRQHFKCDVQFSPDARGSCVQRPGTNLIPSQCPEGKTFKKSRGYVKIPEFNDCKEDNETLATLSPVKTPCPVEKLQLSEVKTEPKMKSRNVLLEVGQSLKVKVNLASGYLPHINFTYKIDDQSTSGVGPKFANFSHIMNKVGSFVLHITVANPKSNLYYSINVNVIRKLNASLFSLMVHPFEASIKEKVTVMLQMDNSIIPREHGFPLSYVWKVEKFSPSQRVIHQTTTVVSTLYVTFNSSGYKRVSLTMSNGINSITVFKDITVTKDLKPKNVKLSFNDPILIVQWDKVEEPNIIRYRVFYSKEGNLFKEASCQPKQSETKCEIRDVMYYTKYNVKVDTVLKDGYGPLSDVQSIQIPSGKPGVPQKVNLANVDAVKLEASWDPPSLPNGKIIGYVYKFYKSGATPKNVTINDPTVTKKSFENLEIDADYLFEVAAENEKYTGFFSEARSARTGVDKPVLPPTGITVTSITSTTVVLTWTPPLLKKGSKIYFSPKSYAIYIKKDGKMVRYDSPTNQYKFKGLEQDTLYTVMIGAVSKAEGPNATFTFKTLLSAPPAPTNLKTTLVTARTASFSWSSTVPSDKVETFTLYQLSPRAIRQSWPFDKSPGTVEGLLPNTKYTFAVSVTNSNSESNKSSNYTFTTKEDRPDKPAEVHVNLLWPESSSVNISWEPPRNPNGKLIQYSVSWHRDDVEFKSDVQQIVTGKRWLQINHLREETIYAVFVRAKTAKGFGDPHVEEFQTHYYAYGSQQLTILFEPKNDVEELFQRQTFIKEFIEAVAKVASIKKIRIADVRRANNGKNGVTFELIIKEELHNSTSTEIHAEMETVKSELQDSFTVMGAKTVANSVTSEGYHTGAKSGREAASGSSNMALIVGLVCAAVIITLVVIIAMMFYRHRRKSAYNKFDNQFQYNHDEDTVRYEGPPEVEMAPPSQKRRNQDIETVPLADADELT